MKYVWEEHDIVCGRRVWGHNRASNAENIIGYDAGDPKKDRWFLLISLADGLLVARYASKADMAEDLNKYGYRPGDINHPKWPDIAPKDG